MKGVPFSVKGQEPITHAHGLLKRYAIGVPFCQSVIQKEKGLVLGVEPSRSQQPEHDDPTFSARSLQIFYLVYFQFYVPCIYFWMTFL